MRRAFEPLSFLVLSLLIGSGRFCLAAEPGPDLLPTVGSIERLDPRLDTLVPKDATIEVLAMGFDWAEGPVWVPDGKGGLPAGSLLFSDIPRNRVHRWKEGEGVSVFLEPSGFTGAAAYGKERGSNGLAIDREGRLISCEHGDRRVSRLEPEGGKRTLADAWQGKRFNSPNDLVVHSSGAIYFTDPPYGLPKGADDPRREIDFCGVYRIGVDGGVTVLARSMTRPNGLGFSPDEKKFYVAQSDPQAHAPEDTPRASGWNGRRPGRQPVRDRPGRRAGVCSRRHPSGHAPYRPGHGQLRLRRGWPDPLHHRRFAALSSAAHAVRAKQCRQRGRSDRSRSGLVWAAQLSTESPF